MATIFEQLESALSGNEVASKLASQSGSLGSVSTLLSSLASHPPAAIGDFSSALDRLPLPDVSVGGGVIGTLGAMKDAVPSAASVADGPAKALAGIGSSLSDELGHALASVLAAVDALDRLAQLDFRGLAPGDSPGAQAAAPAIPPAEAPAAATPPAPPAGAALAQIRGLLEAAPSPLDTAGALNLLHEATAWEDRDRLTLHFLPVIDDIADPLATLLDWKEMSPTQMRMALKASLDDATAFVAARRNAGTAGATTALAGVVDKLHTDTLASIADGLTANLGDLGTAVESGSLAGTGAVVTAANGQLDSYDTLRATFDTDVLAHLPAIGDALHGLAGELEDQIGLVVSGLTAPPGTSMLDEATARLASISQPSALTGLTDWLGTIVAWCQDLVDKLDLSAVEGPLKTVADGARSALAGVEEGLSEATLAVQGAFHEVESLVDELDTAALVTNLESAIKDFADKLVGQLAALFAPVRDALDGAVGSIDAAVGTFDPAQVVTAIHDVLDALAGVLDGPEIAKAIAEIKKGVQTIDDALKQVSFEPVADEVIKDIQGVEQALKGIAAASLPPALQGALSSAVSVLPSDLKPVTDPLTSGFKDLVEGGPVPLVAAIQGEPQKLLDQVKHFDPSSLVGDELSKPWQSLLDDLDAFHPGELLDPVREQVAALKHRLKDQVNPAAALEPLEQPFHDLLDAYDSLKPDEFVKPLQDAVSHAIDSVLDALPLQQVFDALDAMISRVKQATAIGDDGLAVLQHTHDVLAGFAGAQSGLDAWVEPILANVDAAASMPSVQSAFAALTEAVGSTTAAALTGAVDATLDPTLTALAALDPHTRLGKLAQAYHGVSREKLAALPGTAQKTALTALLDRFDPLQPAFGAPYEGLNALASAAQSAKSAVHAVLDETWDQVLHGPDGALADLHDATADPAAAVRQVVGQRFVAPLHTLFSLAEPVAQGVDGIVGQVKRLVDDLEAKVAALVTGPHALGGIKDALQQLVQRLHDVDFGVVTQSLDQLYADVRGKIAALDPAQLAQALQAAFDELLGALDLDQAIPAADVAKLDADYTAVVDKLRALDPKKLVVDAVQPVFEKDVLPLLDAFDITPSLTSIVDRLQALEGDLGTQLGRVNDAYTEMRGAIPAGVGGGAGGGISV